MSGQGDCATTFKSCATTSYGTPQKPATTSVDDAEVVCPNNWYLMNMQYYVGTALPLSGTISLNNTSGSGSFSINNAVGTMFCCQ